VSDVIQNMPIFLILQIRSIHLVEPTPNQIEGYLANCQYLQIHAS